VDEEIGVSSIVGDRRGPLVQLVWGSKVAQFSPTEARAHALRILEAAEAAVNDAFLVEFLKQKVGAGDDIVGLVLVDYRT
jgi:hypothetical protein